MINLLLNRARNFHASKTELLYVNGLRKRALSSISNADTNLKDSDSEGFLRLTKMKRL